MGLAGPFIFMACFCLTMKKHGLKQLLKICLISTVFHSSTAADKHQRTVAEMRCHQPQVSRPGEIAGLDKTRMAPSLVTLEFLEGPVPAV